MNLTKRDKEILIFLNECGFCTMPQIQKQFDLKFPRSYQVLQRLISGGYVIHDQIFRKLHGIYFLTRKGASLTQLPPLSNISLGGYKHQLIITDVRQKLCQLYPGAKWTSERYLKQQKFHYGVGRSGHLADGILIMPDTTKVAIEIELSLKGKHRLEKIFRAYGGTLAFSAAWYYCADNIIPAISAIAGKKSFIKIYSLKELLYGKS